MEKLHRLEALLKERERVCVAFSGGVDSTFLLWACKEFLGTENTLALTAHTPYMPRRQLEEAQKLAKNLGIHHHILNLSIPDTIAQNPSERCYECKMYLLTRLSRHAMEEGFPHLLDGSNLDDLQDYRPGLRALKKLQIPSPLLEAGLSKEDIRFFSREADLPTWNKEADSCLLTRLEFGTTLTTEQLSAVEEGEKVLTDLGFEGVRLRVHGSLARIEVQPRDMDRFCRKEIREQVRIPLEKLGFHFITLDLRGYSMGSLNTS